MRDDQKVTDWNGAELTVGNKAIYGSDKAASIVTVVEITDYDVDYDDELQRPELSPPRIKVRFDDGEENVITSHDTTPVGWNDYPDGPAVLIFAADDLEALQS